jgi:hypothetical protein
VLEAARALEPDARALERAARGFAVAPLEVAVAARAFGSAGSGVAAGPAFARFSLRRPGRERGRLPITPGSSLTP